MSNTNTNTTTTPRPVVTMTTPEPRPRTLGDVYMSKQYPLGERGAGWLGALVTHSENVECWRPENPTSKRTAGLALVLIGDGDTVHALSVDTIDATTSTVAMIERGDWDGSGWVLVDPVGLCSSLAIADARG